MNLFERILSDDIFEEFPPVLVDIGASTESHPWGKILAKHSICLAFDPDARQMGYVNTKKKFFRQMHVIPAVVHPERNGECDFYLASSPECSSTLPLLSEESKKWHFQYFFQLHKKVTFPCITLQEALKRHGLSRIDALKIDTQGTDLRLLDSLPATMNRQILSLELEPGPSVSYQDDDTPGDVLRYMESRKEFRLISLRPYGSQYFPLKLEEKYLNKLQRRLIPTVHRASPLWYELVYLNNLTSGTFTKRDYLLAWILAMIHREYGWALEIAETGKTLFPESRFDELIHHVLRKIPWCRPVIWRILRKIMHRDHGGCQ